MLMMQPREAKSRSRAAEHIRIVPFRLTSTTLGEVFRLEFLAVAEDHAGGVDEHVETVERRDGSSRCRSDW